MTWQPAKMVLLRLACVGGERQQCAHNDSCGPRNAPADRHMLLVLLVELQHLLAHVVPVAVPRALAQGLDARQHTPSRRRLSLLSLPRRLVPSRQLHLVPREVVFFVHGRPRGGATVCLHVEGVAPVARPVLYRASPTPAASQTALVAADTWRGP